MAVLYGLRHTGKTTAMLQAASMLGGNRCAILTFKNYQDADFMGRIEREFGKIKRKAILYCGETKSSSMNGVELLLTSAFLEEISPAFQEIKEIIPSDHICHMSPCQ